MSDFMAVLDLGTTDVVKLEARTKIMRLEAAIKAIPGHMENDCFPLKHIFAPGVYAREIMLPAGSILTGKIHREEHLNFISRGRVQVFTEHGGLEELVGPMTMISKPWTKRTVYAIEETVWTTIHHNPTNETDLVKLEEIIIAPTYGALTGLKELTT